VFAAVAIVIAVIAASRLSRGNPFVGEAVAVISDDARFETATDAGVAFARVASLLQEAGEDCGGDADECGRFFTAAAFAQVTAVHVLDCTRPGIFEARRAMRTYVSAIDDDAEPVPPPPPDCD